MSIQLLPSNFDEAITAAVKIFWANRSAGSGSQGGSRSNVIGGKNLDGFISVVKLVAEHCGIPQECVISTGRTLLTIPGYFRPTKTWDVLVVYRQRLVAAFEFKSQVGSFGNNFNNRTEEVLGNATDFWAAHSKGAYLPTNYAVVRESAIDPRPPFLGYLMLLQDCSKSVAPVSAYSAHYDIFPVFERSSYADRYRILCERLMEENLYSAAAVIMSDQERGQSEGEYRQLSEATSVHSLFREFAGRAAAASFSD